MSSLDSIDDDSTSLKSTITEIRPRRRSRFRCSLDSLDSMSVLENFDFDIEVPTRRSCMTGIRASRRRSRLRCSLISNSRGTGSSRGRRISNKFCFMTEEGSVSVSEAADEFAASTSAKMTLYDEAMHYLGMSFFAYIYSFQRDQSKLGFSRFPFDTVAIESDTMTDFEIIQNEPLKLLPRSLYSVADGTVSDELIEEFGGMTMPQLYIRGMQAMSEYGFPRKATDLWAILRTKGLAALREQKQLGTWKKGSGDSNVRPPLAIPGSDVKRLDGLSRQGLKHLDADKSKHVGRLESEMGLHHIQCAFDQIYKKATKEKDPVYMKIKELLERPRTDKGEGYANDINVEDQLLIHKMMQDMHKETSILRLLTSTSLGSSEILVWIYDRSKEECVYLIFLNPVTKRITVIFRGTVTFEDIMKNTKFHIFDIENPIPEDYEGKTSMLEVNNGYSEYLFVKRQDTGRTKYDEISDRVFEFAEHLWGKDPEFELCVSGHSMGGALATLFAFKASTDPRLVRKDNPKPIRVFTYGGAIPGRISFAKAFQHQEEAGKLVHLRVVMKHDVVPCLHPFEVFEYAHTGYTMTIKTDMSRDKDGNRKPGKAPKVPRYDYIHDLSWWNTWSANISTNFLMNFPWKKPLFVKRAHDPRLYLKALMEAKIDGETAISLRVDNKPAGGGGSGALPVDHHNWTLDKHYAQLKIDRARSKVAKSRSLAAFDFVKVMLLVLGVQQLSGLAWLNTLTSLLNVVSTTVPIVVEIIRASMTTWAPLWLTYALFSKISKTVTLLESKLEKIVSKVGASVE